MLIPNLNTRFGAPAVRSPKSLTAKGLNNKMGRSRGFPKISPFVGSRRLRRMKRDTFLLFFLAVFLHSVALAQIAVVKTANVAAFDEARNGFSSICFENRQE